MDRNTGVSIPNSQFALLWLCKKPSMCRVQRLFERKRDPAIHVAVQPGHRHRAIAAISECAEPVEVARLGVDRSRDKVDQWMPACHRASGSSILSLDL